MIVVDRDGGRYGYDVADGVTVCVAIVIVLVVVDYIGVYAVIYSRLCCCFVLLPPLMV